MKRKISLLQFLRVIAILVTLSSLAPLIGAGQMVQSKGDYTIFAPLVMKLSDPAKQDILVVTPEQGGVLTSSDGQLQLDVPAGAVGSNATIKYRRLPAIDVPGFQSLNIFFELTAQDEFGNPISQFAQDLHFTITYGNISDPNIQNFALYSSQDGTNWSLTPSVVDTTKHQILAQLNHFTYFSVIRAQSCDIKVGEGAPPQVQSRMQAIWQLEYECPIAKAYVVASLDGIDYYAQEFPNGTPSGAIVDNPNISRAFFLPDDVWDQYSPKALGYGGPLSYSLSAPRHYIDPLHNFRGQEIWYMEYGFVAQNADAGFGWEAHRYFPKFVEGEFVWELNPDSGKYRVNLTTKLDICPSAEGVDPGAECTWDTILKLVMEDVDTDTQYSYQKWVHGNGEFVLKPTHEFYITQTLKTYIVDSYSDQLAGFAGYAPCAHYDPDEDAKTYYYLTPAQGSYSFEYACTGNGGPADTTPPVIYEPPVVWQNGLGWAQISVTVTDNIGVSWVNVTLNGTKYPMMRWKGNTYAAIVELDSGANAYTIDAADTSGNLAHKPDVGEYYIWSEMSGEFGNRPWMGYSDDPVNSLIGNFIYSYQDIKIPAVGPDVIIKRWFNGQSHYEGPFGIGWTFAYDIRLTVVDNLLLQGAQLRYADGHTANFEGDGNGCYTSPDATYDQLCKMGDEFVLMIKDQTIDESHKLVPPAH